MSWFEPVKRPYRGQVRVPTMEERAAAMGIPVYVNEYRCQACGRAGNPPASRVVLPDAPALQVWADMLICVNPTACREHCVKIGTWKQ